MKRFCVAADEVAFLSRVGPASTGIVARGTVAVVPGDLNLGVNREVPWTTNRTERKPNNTHMQR